MTSRHMRKPDGNDAKIAFDTAFVERHSFFENCPLICRYSVYNPHTDFPFLLPFPVLLFNDVTLPRHLDTILEHQWPR